MEEPAFNILFKNRSITQVFPLFWQLPSYQRDRELNAYTLIKQSMTVAMSGVLAIRSFSIPSITVVKYVSCRSSIFVPSLFHIR